MRDSDDNLDTSESSNGWARHAAIIVGLTVAVILVYGQNVGHDFVSWDDPLHVTHNRRFHPLTVENLASFWREPYFQEYVPLTYMFLGGETYFAKGVDAEGKPTFDAGVYHAGSVALHVMAVWLVFSISMRVVNRPVAAATGAAVFALHPLQSEAVSWISETRGLLATVLALAAVRTYLGAVSPVADPADTRRGRRGVAVCLHIAAVLLFTLGLLAKPTVIGTPVIAGCLARLVGTKDWRRQWPLLLWVIPGAAVAYVTMSEQSGATMAYVAPWLLRPVIVADAVGFYVWKLVVPLELCTDYGRSPRWLFEGGWSSMAWCVAGLLAMATVYAGWRRQWEVAAGIVVFLAGVAPVLGVLPFEFQDFSTVADRYVYLAMLGPAIIVAWWLGKAPHSAKWATAFCVLAVWGGLSLRQAKTWANDGALFNHLLTVNPASYVGHTKSAVLFAQQGELDRAAQHYEFALETQPDGVVARTNLANLFLRAGDAEAALEHYQALVRLRPDAPLAEANLGRCLMALGRYDSAVEAFEAAVARDPRYLDSRARLAYCLAQVGEVDRGREELQTAEQLDAGALIVAQMRGRIEGLAGNASAAADAWRQAITLGDESAATHLALGKIYVEMRDWQRAEEALKRALNEKPERAEAQFLLGCAKAGRGDTDGARAAWRRVVNDEDMGKSAGTALAWHLATEEGATKEELQEAIAVATGICERSDYREAKALEVLAAAYAATGEFDRAVRYTERAIQIIGSGDQAAAAQRRLEGYRRGEPSRRAAGDIGLPGY